MRCPQCVAERERSRVYDRGQSTTCMGAEYFYDEDGKHHEHDPNVTTRYLSCSRGHRWAEQTVQECSSCDYNTRRNAALAAEGAPE